MKKQVLIGSVLLAAVSAFSQSGHLRPKPVGMINTKMLAHSKFGGVEAAPATINHAPTAKSPQRAAKTSATNVWNSFTSSMNVYGVIIGYTKPLQWNDELNAITFVHRKSPSYVFSPVPSSNAETGAIVSMVSTNCGASWDSTALFADDTHWGRYPGGAIYNPPGNTDINNAYVVGAGPTTGAGNVTWIGNWFASKKLGTANYNNSPSSEFISTTPYNATLVKNDFAAYSFTGTDDGKMRVLAGVTNNSTTFDTAVVLITGTFNSGTNSFDWASTVFNPSVTTESDGTENFVSRPIMAWNEQGTVGYVVIMGQKVGRTGSNRGYQPIVYKTINSGSTWTEENGIDFNTSAFDDVKKGIWPTSEGGDTVPNFFWAEGIDCSVDANNKLHIFTSILGHASSDPDSLNFINQFQTENYLWPHVPTAHPYLYDFIYDGTSGTPSWSHILIDSMSTEGPSGTNGGAGYNYNPWDMDPSQSNQKVRIDARLQMSRTPDGQYMVFTWAESDTGYTDDQTKWNHLPDIKARVMKVSTGAINPVELDITSSASGEIAGHAMYHIVSPKCAFVSDATTGSAVGPVLRVPMTITNSSPYSQLTANTHWFSCATLEFTVAGTPTNTTGIAQNSAEVNNSYIFPNPAKGSATVKMNLSNASKVQLQVLNTIGQVVKTTQAQGQVGVNTINMDLSGLASGIYMVTIKVDNATSTKKLVIE